MSWTAFLLTYLLGGVTFLPLVLAAALAHAYLTLPVRNDADAQPSPAPDDIIQAGDDLAGLDAERKQEAKVRANGETDVAAGYFAVCREYTPMGINAKPIERSTPVGSTTVAAPSPSVYQTMYRSIFDRKQTAGPLGDKNASGQRPKKSGNVFYVVLRHGHLMLFDDDEQLEVRHVVSLAHHEIGIYSGEGKTPEGELFIKRNAICLSRRPDGMEPGPDGQLSKPFYLFSENCSAKEDFYFALLRNQEQSFAAENEAPSPIQFEVKNIIKLVQKLHSSEEHMQTRWLNAMLGRVFLGVYKTKDMEKAIREKLTKKIARVKRPSFLSNIAIKGIDTGESAPYITNPRLKDLTVEGECTVEADVRYTGSFRLEVAATARIDLGSRFKVREVNLVLAVVVRKLEGHLLFKIKPPPSNRIWFSFQQAPKMEMTIEPIVSSRQITYTVILRQIENRIKEVIAETLVLPYWDDVPFFRTEHKKWRGGIFHDDTVGPAIDAESTVAQDGDVDDVDRLEDGHGMQESELPPVEKSHSMPVLESRPATGLGLIGRMVPAKHKAEAPSPASSSASIEIKSDVKAEKKKETKSDPTTEAKPQAKPEATTEAGPETNSESAMPRPGRVASFYHPPAPVVGTDATNADTFRPSSSPPNGSPAASAMATLSAKSQSASTPPTPALAPFKPYITSKSPSHSSSSSSREATDTEKDAKQPPQPRRNTASSTASHDSSTPKSPSPSVKASLRSQTGSIAKGFFGRRDTAPSLPASGSPGAQDGPKRTALAAVSNAAASAKRWGLNALQRHNNDAGPAKNDAGVGHEQPLDLNKPMGRGRPLPPPGVPLPMPDKKTATSLPVPKRKPVPPPFVSKRGSEEEMQTGTQTGTQQRPVPPPPLPTRRQAQNRQQQHAGDGENMLVVAAPTADSEPTTPLSPSHGSSSSAYIQPWVGDVDGTSFADLLHVSAGEDEALPAVSSSCESQAGSPQPTTGHSDNEEDDEYSAWMGDPGPEESTAAAHSSS
ncbi:testis-expressed sequence 2 protein [Diplogelasinospora grovesii]|uniref:Testis-expressed sequence 2 protein n=1 Tax=Diplogelasinospora grovesii TaxID=303347 RepID=A0AAN6NEI6_9PEZI|nr:testis-expressed sequence 2 protein [Diplogelasinospora grovesii]